MSFLLDTDICSAHMRRPARLAHRFIQYTGRLAIPTIVLGELYAGAYKHPNPSRLLSLISDGRNRSPAQAATGHGISSSRSR
jgi:tRNA(fMet)-specific endonuclease VapC